MQNKVQDKRTEPRRNLLYYVNVYEHDTSEYVGLMLDISNSGILLSGVEPLTQGQLYTFGLVDTSDASSPNQIGFEAKACWCRKSSDDFYDTGLSFTGLSDVTREKLESFE